MDITVLGLVGGSHFIEDIQTEVPLGHQVTIPADKALRSKDLWRGISSRQLFQIRVLPNQPPTPPSVDPAIEQDLRTKVQRLEVENQALRDQLTNQQMMMVTQQAESQKAMIAQQSRLDDIVRMLSTGIQVTHVATGTTTANPGVVDEIPAYIPSVITPEVAETRIETKMEEAQNSGLSGAAGKLRELRGKK